MRSLCLSEVCAFFDVFIYCVKGWLDTTPPDGRSEGHATAPRSVRVEGERTPERLQLAADAAARSGDLQTTVEYANGTAVAGDEAAANVQHLINETDALFVSALPEPKPMR